jgi:hypothetical protein
MSRKVLLLLGVTSAAAVAGVVVEIVNIASGDVGRNGGNIFALVMNSVILFSMGSYSRSRWYRAVTIEDIIRNVTLIPMGNEGDRWSIGGRQEANGTMTGAARVCS